MSTYQHVFLFSDPWNWNKPDFRPSIPVAEGPVFDNSLVTNVTAQLGGTAHLQCKVLNIRDKDNPVSVSGPNFFFNPSLSTHSILTKYYIYEKVAKNDRRSCGIISIFLHFN